MLSLIILCVSMFLLGLPFATRRGVLLGGRRPFLPDVLLACDRILRIHSARISRGRGEDDCYRRDDAKRAAVSFLEKSLRKPNAVHRSYHARRTIRVYRHLRRTSGFQPEGK